MIKLDLLTKGSEKIASLGRMTDVLVTGMGELTVKENDKKG